LLQHRWAHMGLGLMLRGWASAGMAFGLVALIGGAATLIGVEPGAVEQSWSTISVLAGLQLVIAGMLMLLLGAIGVGIAEGLARSRAAISLLAQISADFLRHCDDTAAEAEFSPIRTRIAVEHGPEIAQKVIECLLHARRQNMQMSPEAALRSALAPRSGATRRQVPSNGHSSQRE
jgi:hypothetical protein